jgi:2-deoxy-D-gluconate 3-dehydrogenase
MGPALFDLKGKTALVTGGNGGIGLGIAKGLAGAGANIAIAGRNPVKNAAAKAELDAMGGETLVIEVDVTDEAANRAMVATAAERFGALHILVNNAGIARGGRPETLAMESWREVISANLEAVFVASQAAHPLMKAAGGGKIINIGSMYSLFGAGRTVAYSASKGGVVQLTKSLAVAWAPDNIQVNCILPGWIVTEMTEGATQAQAFSDAIVNRTPAGRWGEPDEFAGPAVFLSSAASDFVTGHSLAVDGGFAIQG